MFYHGSKISDIKELIPNYSLHNEKYVYLTTNKAVALIYTVNAIEKYYEDNNLEKPSFIHPWYSYGFNKNRLPVIEEYYLNATKETYSGKSGYIYICDVPNEYSNPTNIYCAVVTKEKVKTVHEEYIEDVYEEILKYEKMGLLKIRYFKDNSEAFQKRIDDYIKDDIKKYKLLENTENNYYVFLKAKFPYIFKQK
ncbi:MAG: hypothetical protein PQJ44_06750 [Sphaerochaetaceae bacterium]|nr:hypothetical protein [Sphaerochaetaceae bacterium]